MPFVERRTASYGAVDAAGRGGSRPIQSKSSFLFSMFELGSHLSHGTSHRRDLTRFFCCVAKNEGKQHISSAAPVPYGEADSTAAGRFSPSASVSALKALVPKKVVERYWSSQFVLQIKQRNDRFQSHREADGKKPTHLRRAPLQDTKLL